MWAGCAVTQLAVAHADRQILPSVINHRRRSRLYIQSHRINRCEWKTIRARSRPRGTLQRFEPSRCLTVKLWPLTGRWSAWKLLSSHQKKNNPTLKLLDRSDLWRSLCSVVIFAMKYCNLLSWCIHFPSISLNHPHRSWWLCAIPRMTLRPLREQGVVSVETHTCECTGIHMTVYMMIDDRFTSPIVWNGWKILRTGLLGWILH